VVEALVSLFGYWYLPDLIAAQKKLCASTASTNTSVTACTQLDATTQSQWAAWYATTTAFCAEVPVLLLPTGSNETLATGSFIDQLELFQRELLAWQQRLSVKCSLAPVVPLQAPNSVSNLFSGLSNPETNRTIQYVAAASAVIAAAYLGTKVVDLLPSAKTRARAARERERTARYAIRRG
jgi:hypothetical protein